MAEDTKKDVAVTVDDGGEPVSTDTLLDQAAADAVAEQTDTTGNDTDVLDDGAGVTTDVVSPELTEQSELDAEGLPADHTERSNLGRKITSFHRRQDEFESRIDRLLGVIEGQQQPAQTQELVLEPNEPVTYAEMERLLDQREKASSAQAEKYNTEYLKALGQTSTNLSDQERDAIFEEMKSITYDPSNNPARDAELNFFKAERAYLRKQLARPKNEKVNPLKGNEPRSALGGTTNQTTVTKEAVLPKLDASGQSYLAYVAREDGEERATNLHRSVGKKE